MLDALVPPSAGHETVKENSGSIVNKGIEFSLNTVNIEKPNFTWTTNFNVSFNKNEILSLTEGEELRLYNPGVNDGLKDEKYYGLFVGEAVGQMYGYRYDGLYQVDDFSHNPNTGELVPNEGVPTVETSSGFVAPGMLKYKDLNGDGVINEYDREVIGTPHPISYGGMTNRFTYKNFDLSVLLTFSYGNDIYNGNRSTTGRPLAGVGRNYLAEVANRWTPENPIETGMWSAPVGTNNYLTTYKGKMMSDYWIEDGSYIRISNVALGYNVPKKLLKKAHIKSMKVSAFVDNLYVFTNYSGYDPEVSVKREAMSAGIDYSAYPRPRTYTLSLNLSF